MRVRQWIMSEDLPLVCDMFYDLTKYHASNSPFSFLFTESREICDKEVINSLNRDTSVCLIAETDEGVPAGFCAISIPTEEDVETELAEIHWLYTKPEYRHKGVGTLLIKCALACMKSLSPQTKGYSIGAAAWNTDAINLYSRLGFKLQSIKMIYAVEPSVLEQYPDAYVPDEKIY